MKCPRCNTEHNVIKGSKIVPMPVQKCVVCNFLLEDNTYLYKTLEKMQDCVEAYKKSNNIEDLYNADTYFQAAITEAGHRKGEEK